jgi:hypothetical protein
MPLVFVTGAGAKARNSIGLVLVGGMTIGTIFTLFIVPSLYVLIARNHQGEVPVGIDIDGDGIPDGRAMPEYAMADGNGHGAWKD